MIYIKKRNELTYVSENKQLIILGNGFDLANGFNTSYNSFMDWILNKEMVDISSVKEELEKIDLYYHTFFLKDYSRDRLAEVLAKNPEAIPKEYKLNIWYLLFIHSSLSDDPNWCDIEYQMYNYLVNGHLLTINSDFEIVPNKKEVIDFQKLIKVLTYSKSQIDTDDPSSLAKYFYESLNELESDFEQFLFKVAGYSKDRILESYMGGCGANEFLNFIVKQDMIKEVPFNLLTFNYTDPWDKRWTKDIDGDVECRISPDKVLMVHGKAKNYKDKSNRLIFGIDNLNVEPSDPNYCFTKTYRTLVLNSQKPAYIQSSIYEPNINIIKFYGHSLCAADYSYFQQMFDFYDLYKNNDLKLYFYFSNWPGSGFTDEEMLRLRVNEVTNLIGIYGTTLDNKYHGKNLLTKMQQTGRIVIKKIEY